MNSLSQYLAVAAAGSIGAVLRLFLGSICGSYFGKSFPVGTFIINITGSLLLGWFLTFADKRALPETTRIAVAVGFVGSYTTFSTFMNDSNSLLKDGMFFMASLNLIGSLVAGLLAVRLGIWLGGG